MGRIPSQEWEQVFQDFRGAAEARSRWLSQYTPTGMLEQVLQASARKEFSLRLQILAFLDENAPLLIQDQPAFDLLLDALRSTLQSPSSSDPALLLSLSSSSLKEQMMVTVTSAMVTLDALSTSPRSLEILVELLLNFINRPNHSAERHLRAIACECLRELEREYPCLLHSASGHLLTLCQSERTHAGQSYTLLLTTVLSNAASFMQQLRSFYAGTYSILFTTLPLVPFSIPAFLLSNNNCVGIAKNNNLSEECVKEFRRVISFLLEKPTLFTECALLEFISALCHIASCLELQPSLLKLQFWNLLNVYNPISCHALLTIFIRFPEAFDEAEEADLYKRLVLFSREYAQALTIRLLALHWLRGLESLVVAKRGREPLLPSVAKSLYPQVFDPLSLKAAKLDCLAKCAAVFDKRGSFDNGVHVIQEAEADTATKLLLDGLTCLSSYKWLPSDSSETRLLFHSLHRFLIYGFPHSGKAVATLENQSSLLFRSLQELLVNMATSVRRLVDRILALLDRFLSCESHHGLGERLLRTFSEELIPVLPTNLNLSFYFPLMERIAESSRIPPGALILSLAAYLRYRVEKDSRNEAARLWLRGTEVLTICRTLLIHHQSSRVFPKLTGLLGYLCLSFPDIEVRDSARFYLRMLISVPGNKLRDILMYGDERTEDSKPQLLHVSSFLASASPRAYQGKKHSQQVSSFIHLNRETPLLVRSSWSLVLHNSFQPILKTFSQDSQNPNTAEQEAVNDEGTHFPVDLNQEQVPRMMDAKTAEALSILRRHFSEVPESGVKIEVVCRLKMNFLANQGNIHSAVYAVVISFSTTGVCGPIPDVRIPFLRNQPRHDPEEAKSRQLEEDEGVGRVKFLDSGSYDEKRQQQQQKEDAKQVKVVLEPTQPVPALVDCYIVFTDEDAQTVQGQLESIPVGIEDLFMKPPVPEGVSNQQEYLLGLFNALWYGCSGPGKLGSEIFLLRGGNKGIGLQGSESVKLLEAQADRVVSAVENHLAEFVVSVSGSVLKQMMENTSAKFRVSEDLEEKQEELHQVLRLELTTDAAMDEEQEGEKMKGRPELGCILVLVFLPPRYHLLLRMEVSCWSTLIRMRTDYWPSLAHVDEFLESFIIPGTNL